MSDYKANYESALTYRKVGYNDKAVESLERAYAQLNDEDKSRENRDYVNILRMLIKTRLEQKDLEGAAKTIAEAIKLDPQDADFLFLNLMLLLDAQLHSEMFPVLVNYLLSVDLAKVNNIECEYGSDEAVDEVIKSVLPLSVSHMHDIEDLEYVVKEIFEKAESESIKKLLVSMEQYKKAS
jgi:tetratricopeptide (TPR) repeat protein